MVANNDPNPDSECPAKCPRTAVAKTLAQITVGQIIGWLIRRWWE